MWFRPHNKQGKTEAIHALEEEPMPYTHFVQVNPDVIRKAQIELDLTNWQVAHKLGVGTATWDRWKATGRVPRKKYPAFCEALDLPVDENPPAPLDDHTTNQVELLRNEVRALHNDMQILLSEMETLKSMIGGKR